MVDLAEHAGKAKDRVLLFGCKNTDSCFYENFLDIDGLPPIGRLITPGQPFYSYYDVQTGEYTVKNFKIAESGYTDDIAILNSDSIGINKVNIRIRIPRNPIVGDKFSSRHGQKGILSILWPAEDMPFTENGIIPDIIFNPHGFPSRMTIGMMIENMASKVGAVNGKYFDCSPFKNENNSLVDYFGEKLSEVGYNYYGSERMYSGTNGEELEVNIFTGIVYYQRLRHMVSDKFQVRNTGPVDALTHQPIGGRNRGGGVRFGEMERDALISHGCSFLLQDRLLDCSDKSLAFVCEKCGDILATKLDPARSFNPLINFRPPSVSENKNSRQFVCLLCKSSAHIKPIFIPYVFRYLLVELASMNIQIKLNF
uniref:DNA-directed RNA polymerase n=1 Tax=Henneguya salminicola TaxID=69463 RepID=A0A6G3MG51_HENSL